MNTGTVYFFTGLSGAGKTTIGGLFYERCKKTKPNVVLLDGDTIRIAFGEDMGYTNAERERWAKRIFRVCKLLADQGQDVICCSIAMFQPVRDWNRANIENYKEIYIKVKKETLLERNQKGLYTAGVNVVGVDLPFDEPTAPDLVVQNDGNQTPLELVEEIERALYPHIVENPIDNRVYWNQYYQNRICATEPSPFAQYVSTLVDAGQSMLELGCGNGRDAVFFANCGLNVTAIDLSKEAITQLKSQNVPNAIFICEDFINSEVHRPNSFDCIYSRFTLHAINQNQERLLLQKAFRTLRANGRFFIEVRSVNDPIFGKGAPLERNAFFYDHHYRRFIVLEELTAALQEQGFRIEYAAEQTGFAPYGNDDPPVIRIAAVRSEAEVSA